MKMTLLWNFVAEGQIEMGTLERQFGWCISPATGLLPISFCKAQARGQGCRRMLALQAKDPGPQSVSIPLEVLGAPADFSELPAANSGWRKSVGRRFGSLVWFP